MENTTYTYTIVPYIVYTQCYYHVQKTNTKCRYIIRIYKFSGLRKIYTYTVVCIIIMSCTFCSHPAQFVQWGMAFLGPLYWVFVANKSRSLSISYLCAPDSRISHTSHSSEGVCDHGSSRGGRHVTGLVFLGNSVCRISLPERPWGHKISRSFESNIRAPDF